MGNIKEFQDHEHIISEESWEEMDMAGYIFGQRSEQNRREMKLWGYIPEYSLIIILKVPKNPM